jgi:murein DD-endopeptidase MepM/ murein hydrolase activator NlpD
LRTVLAVGLAALFALCGAGLALGFPQPRTPPATTAQTTSTSPTPTVLIPQPEVSWKSGRQGGWARAPKASIKKPTSKPLTVTPPLGADHYIFPVVGDVGYGDSYGFSRPDAPGGWHHGDDLFAAIGAPVVAVADGTLSKVGWERLGGWRLWVYDSAGDGFYYAHLSGYTPLALHRTHVKAGQVLGFVGDTGDADGGASHLHFEIHPASLASLGENGAVDPTTYLQSWRRLEHVRAGNPVHLPFPPGLRGQDAARTFGELLAARPPAVPALPTSGGIQPILLRDLSAVPAAPTGPTFAVITGVIQVVAPNGAFELRIGWLHKIG